MKFNKAGYELIKEFEGERLNAYLCPAGVWTIGIGLTRIYGRRVRQGDKITAEESKKLFMEEVDRFARNIKPLIKVPLTDNQFSSLVSFAFNVGVGAFANSTLLRILNQGDYAGVPAQLARWNKAGGRVLAGLTRRRKAEAELFMTR